MTIGQVPWYEAMRRDTGNILSAQSPEPAATPQPTALAPPTVAPSTSYALGASPAWLAYRRALGFADTDDAATVQSQIDVLNARAGLSRGDLLQQGQRDVQEVGSSFETRGLYRSGARLRGQARAAEDTGRRIAGMEADTAMDSSQLLGELARRQSERQRDLAEKGLEVGQSEMERYG